MPDDVRDGSGGDGRARVVTTVVAIGLLVVYLLLVGRQWGDVDQEHTAWLRRQSLLIPLEALAFAAAGVLLGTTVQRQATTKAEDRAADAERRATDNARDAEKGRALQKAIEARQQAGAAARQGVVTRGTDAAADPLAELAALARKYDEEEE